MLSRMPVEYNNLEKSFKLYRKGKHEGTWDPDDYGLDQDIEDWESFSETERQQFLAMASGFYDGEEHVTRTLAPYMIALDQLDSDQMPFDPVQEEIYLSQQLYEEAKHTDFFSRYYETVFDTQDTQKYRVEIDAYTTDDLFGTSDGLLGAVQSGDQHELITELAEAYLNYMAITEAQLARVGYVRLDQMFQSKAEELGRGQILPGFQAAVGKIRQDETRHIANGRWMLQRFAEYDPAIVTEVYEPRLIEYIENRILTEEVLEFGSFAAWDPNLLEAKKKQYLQDTIDHIGAEKFDQLSDVRAAIETMEAESENSAIAGED